MSKYYADDDINNPEHPEFDLNAPVGIAKKATPKLRYFVAIMQLGEEAKNFNALYEQAESWFRCHNTDPVDTFLRVEIDHLCPYDSKMSLDFIFDARMEDLEPACEQFAKGNIEVVLFLDDECGPGKMIAKFNPQGDTRY